MALPPRFSKHAISFFPNSSPSSTGPLHPHTLELHLDYTCPFSARLFRHLLTTLALIPTIPNPYGLNIIFRQQVQPWHPTSTLVHEAALVAERLGKMTGQDWQGNPFWKFSQVLFEKQGEFADHKTAAEGRDETYGRLAKMLKETVGINEEAALKELRLKEVTAGNEGGNVGNSVEDDLKWHIKQARYASIHVSPTALWDGITDNSISSNWEKDQWVEYFNAQLSKP